MDWVNRNPKQVTRSIACRNQAEKQPECDPLVYVTGGWPGFAPHPILSIIQSIYNQHKLFNQFIPRTLAGPARESAR